MGLTKMSASLLRYLLVAVLTGVLLVPSAVSQIAGQYRLCVPDVLFAICQQMVSDSAAQGGRFECVPGNDKIDCIGRVTKGEADVVILEPEEIYVAHRFFHDAFYVASEIRTQARAAGSFRYEPVAVVRNSAQIKSLQDLRGKKSCHTGFARTSGWEVPLARLMQKNIMVRDCSVDLTTIEREISSAYIFFGDSCIPGSWAPDTQTDGEYKQRYSKLCSLCHNPQQCKEDDQYSGFRGSLRCLTENGGDIAWTKLDTVYRFFSGQTQLSPDNNAQNSRGRNNNQNGNSDSGRFSLSASEYSFLCPDGTSRPINTNNPCTWAGRPWRSFLVTNRLSATATIADIQQQITLLRTLGQNILSGVNPPPAISWLADILEFGGDEVEFHVPTSVAATVTPLAYLDRGNYTMTIEKPSCPSRRTVRICVRNEIEKLKCRGLLMASYGRRISPYFECVQGEGKEDCMRKITTGQADVLSVDAREAYVGSKRLRLTPILSEAERFGDDETDASRYAVAVVRADAGVQSIVDLRGKRSCHGSVSSLTGWNIPLIVLRDSGLIFPGNCQFGRALAGFFSGGSCVPGAKRDDLNLPETLCSLCVGSNLDAPGLANEQSFCADNESEGFYGDLGAFRCLATFQGDVAFIDHLTPLLNTDGYANATWATGLVSANFRLVCPFGPTRAITEFRQCHWGRIPTDKVITTEDKDYVEREDLRLTLLKASQTFHTEQVLLRLFGPYYGIPNLLFKDTSIGLVSLNEDGSESRRIDQYGRYVNANKDIVYDKQYANRIIRDVDDCNGSRRTANSNGVLVYLAVGMAVAMVLSSGSLTVSRRL